MIVERRRQHRTGLGHERGDALGALAIGDVEHRADHPHRLPILRPRHIPAVEHLGEAAVGALEAILVRPRRAALLDDAVDAADDALAVVGMQMAVPPLQAVIDLIGRVAEHRLQRVVPDDRAVLGVPIPDHVVRRARHERVSLMRAPRLVRRLLDVALRGDVLDDGDGVLAAQRHRHASPNRRTVFVSIRFIDRVSRPDAGQQLVKKIGIRIVGDLALVESRSNLLSNIRRRSRKPHSRRRCAAADRERRFPRRRRRRRPRRDPDVTQDRCSRRDYASAYGCGHHALSTR